MRGERGEGEVSGETGKRRIKEGRGMTTKGRWV